MSGRVEIAQWPAGTRTVLEIGIGTVIGTGLTRASLEQLQSLWKPAVLITLTLVIGTGGRAVGESAPGVDPDHPAGSCTRWHQRHEPGGSELRRWRGRSCTARCAPDTVLLVLPRW